MKKPTATQLSKIKKARHHTEDVPITTLEDLSGCIGYDGPARGLEDMEAAIAQGARDRQ